MSFQSDLQVYICACISADVVYDVSLSQHPIDLDRPISGDAEITKQLQSSYETALAATAKSVCLIASFGFVSCICALFASLSM